MDMKRLMQIVDGIDVKAPTPTASVPTLNVAKDAKPSMIGKYFKAVEEEFAESETRSKDRAAQLAERVTAKMTKADEGILDRVFGKKKPAATPAPAPADASGQAAQPADSGQAAQPAQGGGAIGNAKRALGGRAAQLDAAEKKALGEKRKK